jgi:glucose/arabinose dehydrogenase
MMMKKAFILSLTCVFLAGCSSMNLFKDDAPPAAEPDAPAADLAPEEPIESQTARTAGGLSAADINKALAGKSWNWKAPKNSGVTLYANDGSSLIEVAGKGTTTGKWLAKDGQLCEKFEPASFLPKGQPMTCRSISGGGSAFQVGDASFTLAQ